MNRALLLLLCLQVYYGTALAQSRDRVDVLSENLLANGDFEKGFENWLPFWIREAGAGKATLDTTDRRGGVQAARVEHTGEQDWSLAHSLQAAVEPGEILELSAWVRFLGAGSASLGVVTRDAAGTVLAWDYAGRPVRETTEWRAVRTRFVVPPSVATVQPRLTGYGRATAWADDVVLTRQGSVDALRKEDLPAAVSARRGALEITLHTADASLEVRDRRARRRWIQQAVENPLLVLDARAVDAGLDLRLLDPASMRELDATVRLDGDRPELVVTV
ncbi:MAG: carbohydrate binding domain-containing protein, partial [Kiritimatiellae bacterium]|nr:carbohydrate binding domain-containing protein [Kiritimatiellia bacterium]